jgi:hypothetical protein
MGDIVVSVLAFSGAEKTAFPNIGNSMKNANQAGFLFVTSETALVMS